MGPIHPRLKKPIGERLAQAAHTLVYQAKGYMYGPTISGCRVDPSTNNSPKTLRLKFGDGTDPILLKSYKRTATVTMSSVRVLTNSSNFCVESRPINGTWYCINDGADTPKPTPSERPSEADTTSKRLIFKCFQEYVAVTGESMLPTGFKIPNDEIWSKECRGLSINPAAPVDNNGINPFENPEQWVTLNITTAEDDSSVVVVDLTPLGGAPIYAVRYAWGNIWDQCCEQGDDLGVSRICPPASCPIHGEKSGLPANPFLARITDEGVCQCISPQECSSNF